MTQPISVIFADGNSELRDTVRGQFEPLGFATLLAATGHEAISYAASIQARLVLLSYYLLPSSGLDACERIRELPGYAGVPIMLMAHPDVPRLNQKAKSAGASALMFKPFSVGALLRDTKPFLLDPDRPLIGARQEGLGGPATPPPGFSETAMIWQSGPVPQRSYGEESRLTQGKLALDVYRQAAVRRAGLRTAIWLPRR